eukprot:509581-Alexandrium_andersonii.AAC.1
MRLTPNKGTRVSNPVRRARPRHATPGLHERNTRNMQVQGDKLACAPVPVPRLMLATSNVQSCAT